MSNETSLMDDKTPIRYLLIGDTTNNKIITEFSIGSQQKAKKEINQIFTKLCKSSSKKYDERNKVSSKNENYYFIQYKPDLLYIILANNQYPERLVFELIEKIHADKIAEMVNDETRELNPSGRQALKALVDSYQEVKNKNKIAEIQASVDLVKDDIKKNINKMVKNLEDVEDLQNKSDNLRNEAKIYNDNSVTLRKVTWWQNFKLWIIIGGIILIIIAIILICIFT